MGDSEGSESSQLVKASRDGSHSSQLGGMLVNQASEGCETINYTLQANTNATQCNTNKF